MTVQNVMQRFQFASALYELTDLPGSPGQDALSESARVVPDSFADWLARPSQTITSEPKPEQGIFLGLMSECRVRATDNQPVPRRD